MHRCCTSELNRRKKKQAFHWTFAYKFEFLTHSSIRRAYFEIDDENILAFKKAILEENGIDANVRFTPRNYVRDGRIDLLKKSEFDFERPTHFIWEGNTMYLTAAAVNHVLADITRYVRQFTVSFDYVTEEAGLFNAL